MCFGMLTCEVGFIPAKMELVFVAGSPGADDSNVFTKDLMWLMMYITCLQLQLC